MAPTDRYESVAGEHTLDDERLRVLYRRWRAACGSRTMPTRSFVDPVNLADFLGWLFIYDIEGPQPRFRYRLFASAVAARVGFDLTGKLVDDHPIAHVRDSIRHSLDLVVNGRSPVRVSAERLLLGKCYRSEVLLMPLGEADGQVDRILGCQSVPPDMPRQWVLGER